MTRAYAAGDSDGPTTSGTSKRDERSIGRSAGTRTDGEHGDSRGRKRLGNSGERLAATWLEARGYRIVARNWRCPWGELDLIAEDCRTNASGSTRELVFVEVKTRRGEAMGLPEEALTRRKQQHLVAAAQSYLEAAGTPDRAYRIDVVAIQLAPSGKLLDVRHYERAIGE